MTSPPYWALRDYGVKGQLGLEPTFDEYINKLCNIFDEVKRVLRDDGTCWVNLGDTYFGSGKCAGGDNTPRTIKGKLPDKTLTMIPMRFALEMINRGWILRNTIIWHKPNCMPSSAKDRFTVDFEYIFFFSKKKKYYFETQYEKGIIPAGTLGAKGSKERYDINKVNSRPPKAYVYTGKRNKRAVWKINTKPFKEAHFAVYPEELCETPIKAGCPEFICKKCRKPRESIIETENLKRTRKVGEGQDSEIGTKGRAGEVNIVNERLSDCGCNAEFTGGIVLDPFFGAGTTGVVALKQDKKFIGIELNEEYIKIANKRLKPHLE
jgi:site-specific DNA-methyltransferase (adenine-specific)